MPFGQNVYNTFTWVGLVGLVGLVDLVDLVCLVYFVSLVYISSRYFANPRGTLTTIFAASL
ncbi:MAG: hypothetical protein D4R88_09045 [Methanosarcinales archaeon]|nr:MAG: hypothetical protein D4R88_09045 [Methanosarcinales archaeon]